MAQAALAVQLEQLAAHPGVYRVGRDVDGHIPQDLDPLGVGIGLDLLPLLAEHVLQKLPEADLLRVFGGVAGQGLPVAQAVLPRPLGPGLHLLLRLDGHVEGVIVQPVLIGQCEGVVIVGVVGPAAVPAGAAGRPGGIGRTQQRIADVVDGAVVDAAGVRAEVGLLQLLGGQQALLAQSLQVDEIGVARKGRAALVGAVPIAGGAEGQDLPDVLARRRQEVHKFDSLRPEAADPVRAGQAGHRH